MIDTSAKLRHVVHGFTGRAGGVSTGPYESLNLGRKWGDDPLAVAENYRRVAMTAGYAASDLRLARQVHGVNLLRARDLKPDSEADALWVAREDGPLVVGVLTADCVPVLLLDREGAAAVAIHSGWRGTVANIVGACITSLASRVPPQRWLAAIGPCIEVEAFEVGEEVASQFAAEFVRRRDDERPHVDLVAAVRSQLVGAGVPAADIDRVGGCTWQHPQRYYSYRRSGSSTGQMLALVSLLPATG